MEKQYCSTTFWRPIIDLSSGAPGNNPQRTSNVIGSEKLRWSTVMLSWLRPYTNSLSNEKMLAFPSLGLRRLLWSVNNILLKAQQAELWYNFDSNLITAFSIDSEYQLNQYHPRLPWTSFSTQQLIYNKELEYCYVHIPLHIYARVERLIDLSLCLRSDIPTGELLFSQYAYSIRNLLKYVKQHLATLIDCCKKREKQQRLWDCG